MSQYGLERSTSPFKPCSIHYQYVCTFPAKRALNRFVGAFSLFATLARLSLPYMPVSIFDCLQSFTVASIAIRLALLYICFIETTQHKQGRLAAPRLTNVQRGNTMNKTRAFLLGLLEFRQSFTTNCGDYSYEYEQGRDFAHFLTFRVFDA